MALSPLHVILLLAGLHAVTIPECQTWCPISDTILAGQKLDVQSRPSCQQMQHGGYWTAPLHPSPDWIKASMLCMSRRWSNAAHLIRRCAFILLPGRLSPPELSCSKSEHLAADGNCSLLHLLEGIKHGMNHMFHSSPVWELALLSPCVPIGCSHRSVHVFYKLMICWKCTAASIYLYACQGVLDFVC